MGKMQEGMDIKFIMDKKEVPRHVAEKVPILASGSMVGSIDKVFAFTDESPFLTWLERIPGGEKYFKLNRIAETARKLEKSDDTEIMKVLQRRTNSIVRELEDLAARYNLPINSEELFLKATAIDCNPLEGPVFDPTIIYQHINYEGSWRPLPWSISNFRWIGFNDKASSMRVIGAGILFEHINFKGRQFYFGGMPYMGFPDFRVFTFNDLASSVLLI